MPPGLVRTCPGRVGPLTVQCTHLLGMDATTQITSMYLTQRELAELLRLPNGHEFAVGDQLVGGGGGATDNAKLPDVALASCGDSVAFIVAAVDPKS